MPKFGIVLYLAPNLSSCIAYAKFNVKFSIVLENIFYAKMPNFSIGTQIWQCIGDALTATEQDSPHNGLRIHAG